MEFAHTKQTPICENTQDNQSYDIEVDEIMHIEKESLHTPFPKCSNGKHFSDSKSFTTPKLDPNIFSPGDTPEHPASAGPHRGRTPGADRLKHDFEEERTPWSFGLHTPVTRNGGERSSPQSNLVRQSFPPDSPSSFSLLQPSPTKRGQKTPFSSVFSPSITDFIDPISQSELESKSTSHAHTARPTPSWNSMNVFEDNRGFRSFSAPSTPNRAKEPHLHETNDSDRINLCAFSDYFSHLNLQKEFLPEHHITASATPSNQSAFSARNTRNSAAFEVVKPDPAFEGTVSNDARTSALGSIQTSQKMQSRLSAQATPFIAEGYRQTEHTSGTLAHSYPKVANAHPHYQMHDEILHLDHKNYDIPMPRDRSQIELKTLHHFDTHSGPYDYQPQQVYHYYNSAPLTKEFSHLSHNVYTQDQSFESEISGHMRPRAHSTDQIQMQFSNSADPRAHLDQYPIERQLGYPQFEDSLPNRIHSERMYPQSYPQPQLQPPPKMPQPTVYSDFHAHSQLSSHPNMQMYSHTTQGHPGYYSDNRLDPTLNPSFVYNQSYTSTHAHAQIIPNPFKVDASRKQPSNRGAIKVLPITGTLHTPTNSGHLNYAPSSIAQSMNDSLVTRMNGSTHNLDPQNMLPQTNVFSYDAATRRSHSAPNSPLRSNPPNSRSAPNSPRTNSRGRVESQVLPLSSALLSKNSGPRLYSSGNTSDADSKSVSSTDGSRSNYKDVVKQFREYEKQDFWLAMTYAIEQLNSIPQKFQWKLCLEMADLAKRENRLDIARYLYKRTGKDQPTASQVWLDFSKMEEELGDTEKSDSILEIALEQCRLDENVLSKAIKQWERRRQPKLARGLVSLARELPEDKQHKIMLEGALLEARAGNTAIARQAFKYLMTKYRWSGPIYCDASRLEERCENYDKAIYIVEKGLEATPRYGPLWFCALRLYEKKEQDAADLSGEDDFQQTRGVISRAVSKIPKELCWKIWFEAAHIEERIGRRNLRKSAQPVCYEHVENENDRNPSWILDALTNSESNSHYLHRCRQMFSLSAVHAPTNLRWKVWLAGSRVELSVGQKEISRRLLKRALEEVPGKSKPQVFIECARHEEYFGNIDKARSIMSLARQEAKQEWKVFLESVLLEIRAGCLIQAMHLAELSLKVHVGTGRLWAVFIQLKSLEGLEAQEEAFIQALHEVPKSGEVWCEGARLRMNPFYHTFNLDEAEEYLQYAIQFTPQYGDSFIEYLRLIYLRCSRLRSSTILQCSKRRFMHYLHNEVEIEAMQQECINADPNYGSLWFFCKNKPYSTVRQILRRAKHLIIEDIEKYRHVYHTAIMKWMGTRIRSPSAHPLSLSPPLTPIAERKLNIDEQLATHLDRLGKSISENDSSGEEGETNRNEGVVPISLSCPADFLTGLVHFNRLFAGLARHNELPECHSLELLTRLDATEESDADKELWDVFYSNDLDVSSSHSSNPPFLYIESVLKIKQKHVSPVGEVRLPNHGLGLTLVIMSRVSPADKLNLLYASDPISA